jgi:AcrR family transcriptional regulator
MCARAIGANSTRVAGCGGVSIGTLYQHYPNKQCLLFISTALYRVAGDVVGPALVKRIDESA